jgi:hypothetical protein
LEGLGTGDRIDRIAAEISNGMEYAALSVAAGNAGMTMSDTANQS